MKDDAAKMAQIFDETTPAGLDYSDWVRMGMAAKSAGLSCDDWSEWSRKDPDKYEQGCCEARWGAFNGSVKIGSAVFIAKKNGFVVPRDWFVETVAEKYADRFVKPAAKPSKAMTKEELFAWLKNANKAVTTEARRGMACDQITAMFADDEFIATARKFDKEDAPDPDGDYPEDEEPAFADAPMYRFDTAANVKARISESTIFPRNLLVNPITAPEDGARMHNIADFRYILIEADNVPLYEQYKTFIQLNLPIVSLTYSGNKSFHAIVRVNADSLEQYRERFALVRDLCAANGTPIDEACSNPNRWSRLSGARRGYRVQTLVATNIGAASWEEWESIARAVLADIEKERKEAEEEAKREELARIGIRKKSLSDIMTNPPEAVPHVICNALKKGREGILIASSKAGKSWLMLKLAKAVADGGEWLGYKCNSGKVGVVNMELGEDDIFERMKLINEDEPIQHPENIAFLNCAGVCSDLKTLQKVIEDFATEEKLDLLVIDPIYSLMGELEENKNGDVMQFLERLAQIRARTGCASFMTHHTSKGSQDGKASIDMGSGAGAFARHPDAIFTLMTAARENIKGIDEATLEYEQSNGVSYFVFNETLRSFKSTRKEEIWRADFPKYTRVESAGYDRMGAAHVAKTDASVFKYRNAVQECLKRGWKPTQAKVAEVAGVQKSTMSEWVKKHPEEWENITAGAVL